MEALSMFRATLHAVSLLPAIVLGIVFNTDPAGVRGYFYWGILTARRAMEPRTRV
jgi:hypothetical protein